MPNYDKNIKQQKYFSSFENIIPTDMADKIKEITPVQYAKWYGCHKSYIHKALLNEKLELLPHVLRVKKYGRFYVMEVPEWLSKDSFKEIKSTN